MPSPTYTDQLSIDNNSTNVQNRTQTLAVIKRVLSLCASFNFNARNRIWNVLWFSH